MTEYLLVTTTTEKKEDAKIIASELIEKRLAACIQLVGPIMSLYRWNGKISEDEEWLLIIKTGKHRYQELERTVKEIHPYEVPEIIASPIIKGSSDYLKWLDTEIGPSLSSSGS